MKDDHVPGIVDDAVPVMVKGTDDVQDGTRLAHAVKPGLTKYDCFIGLCFLIDNMQYL